MLGKVTAMKNEAGKSYYTWVELSKEEIDDCMMKLMSHNVHEFERCWNEATNLCDRLKEGTLEKREVASALFEKQGTASFTVLLDMLEKKKFEMKNTPVADKSYIPAANNLGKEQRDKIDKQVEEQLNKDNTTKDAKGMSKTVAEIIG